MCSAGYPTTHGCRSQPRKLPGKNWLTLIPREIPLILEFVKEDQPEQFRQDMETLQKWLPHNTCL